jgi:ABC-type transport system involved in cytochrome c biogenesis permease subunit
MAAFLWPLSVLSRRQTGADTAFQDALLGLIILFPAGFVFSEEVRRLPPAFRARFSSRMWELCGGLCAAGAVGAMALPLFRADAGEGVVRQADAASRQTAAVGFVLLTVGLLLGSLWGKICWGHYWQWDPKEMWSLATVRLRRLLPLSAGKRACANRARWRCCCGSGCSLSC